MIATFARDLKLAFSSGAMTGVIFFLAVVATIPFGIGPDLNLLARIGPAILWIGALLAALLTLDRLFQADREDGTLDLLLMGPTPLPLVILAKCAAHWVASGLPLVVAAPLLGLFLALDPTAIGAVMATLVVGTPAITLIGAVGAAVAVALPRGGLLVSVLVLPLAIPVLIFGVSATYGAVNDPDPFLPPFMILVALTLFFGALGPIAAAAALRASGD
ncbi:heme exporter protein CcmB [Consotaella aegiceratis]|uniref:heme exporter protein CcmB n=1 Tax=Consotaella aegiceratis TaxID=3097961 RepID=UPI002F3FC28D